VTDGIVKRNGLARVLRDGTVLVPASRIETLRRFTEDANEVRTGFECGIRLSEGDDLLQEGDVIEVYERKRVR
jgi:translation initiation factor IF-2